MCLYPSRGLYNMQIGEKPSLQTHGDDYMSYEVNVPTKQLKNSGKIE